MIEKNYHFFASLAHCASRTSVRSSPIFEEVSRTSYFVLYSTYGTTTINLFPMSQPQHNMSKPFDYSKWDNIELSDDEDDVHPNIDRESWFRMKHRSRVEREEAEEKDKKRIRDEVCIRYSCSF
jgi:Cdc37 N terminal kinase binding